MLPPRLCPMPTIYQLAGCRSLPPSPPSPPPPNARFYAFPPFAPWSPFQNIPLGSTRRKLYQLLHNIPNTPSRLRIPQLRRRRRGARAPQDAVRVLPGAYLPWPMTTWGRPADPQARHAQHTVWMTSLRISKRGMRCLPDQPSHDRSLNAREGVISRLVRASKLLRIHQGRQM